MDLIDEYRLEGKWEQLLSVLDRQYSIFLLELNLVSKNKHLYFRPSDHNLSKPYSFLCRAEHSYFYKHDLDSALLNLKIAIQEDPAYFDSRIIASQILVESTRNIGTKYLFRGKVSITYDLNYR